MKALGTALTLASGIGGGLSALDEQENANPQTQNSPQSPNQPQPNQPSPTSPPQSPAPQQQFASVNPIQEISPALHKFLEFETLGGRPPVEALNLAKKQGFLKDIEKVSKTLGTRLFDIVDQVYGGHGASPSQQSMGQGQQALMAILQQIQKTRGG